MKKINYYLNNRILLKPELFGNRRKYLCGKNDFAEVSKNLNTNLKIILFELSK